MDYDPGLTANITDPYPVFRRLQDEDPVHWNPHLKGWVLTRYEHVRSVLQDSRFSSARMEPLLAHAPEASRESLAPLAKWVGLWAVFRDPPDHTRLRGLMNHAFLPGAVAKLHPRIERLTDQLLDRVAADGRMDVITDLAYPLPIGILAGLLGLPEQDTDRLKGWSDELALFVGGAQATPDKYPRAEESVREIASYFQALIDERRSKPGYGGDDLIGQMIRSEQEGRASRDEIVGSCILILFAGHETTTHLIGNGIWLLLRHPDQLQRLRRDTTLLESAVEEILRFEGPAQSVARVALEDLAIEGRTIHRGDRVFLMLSAANRDPRTFAHSDAFDIGRADNAHLAFGLGLHFCIGAPLARLEGRVALERFLARCADVRAEIEEPQWLDTLTFRGFRSLPIRFRPSASRGSSP